MLFIKLVKPFIRPWVIIYAGLYILNLFTDIPYFTVLLNLALVYGTFRRRTNFTYYPKSPALWIRFADLVLDSMIMYHETILQLSKMARMCLPFLGQYEWIHKNDARVQPKDEKKSAPESRAPSSSLSTFLNQRPVPIYMTMPVSVQPFKANLPVFEGHDFLDEVEQIAAQGASDYTTRATEDDAYESQSDDGEKSIHMSTSELDMNVAQLAAQDTEQELMENIHMVSDYIEKIKTIEANVANTAHEKEE